MSVRNLQESYLFHDKKIYALAASALHVTCVLSVFFHSFLTQSHVCSGQEGSGAELQQTRAPRPPDTARTQCSYGASLVASLGVRERPWFLQLRSGTPVHCPHSAGTSKRCQLRALVKFTGVERDQKRLRGGDTKLFLWCIRRRVCSQSTQLMWRFHDRPQMIQGNAATPCLLQWQAGTDFRLISNAYPMSVPHFLHITASNVASTGSALSLGKDKDPSIKLTATQAQSLPPPSAAGAW